MIRRAGLVADLYRLLENEYVALLGQAGSGLESVLHELQTDGRSRDFGFVSLMLPRTVRQPDEFTDRVIERLIHGTELIPGGKSLTKALVAAMRANKAHSADFRLDMLLDLLGRRAPTRRLVIIMHTLPDVENELLHPLLTTLRDYHPFRRKQGHAGERLRFLVAGDAALWRLCYYKQPKISPFNIAKRVFVKPLADDELALVFPERDAGWRRKLRVVTAGTPSLVEVAHTAADLEELAPFFAEIQAHWNALADDSRDALLRSVSVADIRDTIPDFECPDIPELRSPWLEAFWQGFLRVEGRKLVWSCEAHRCFVEHQQHTSQRRTAVRARASRRNLVFISYSRHDDRLVNELRVQLGGMEREGMLSAWIDVEELPGTLWRSRLEDAIQQARVAVLLVSGRYLDSEFIMNDELPAILKRTGLTVLPVILSSCLFDEKKSLSRFGAFNSPRKPLDKLRKPQRTEQIRNVVRKVVKLLEPAGRRTHRTDRSRAREQPAARTRRVARPSPS
jgi:hypothetical protein